MDMMGLFDEPARLSQLVNVHTVGVYIANSGRSFYTTTNIYSFFFISDTCRECRE